MCTLVPEKLGTPAGEADILVSAGGEQTHSYAAAACYSIGVDYLKQCPQFTKYTQDASQTGSLTTQSATEIAAKEKSDNPQPTAEYAPDLSLDLSMFAVCHLWPYDYTANAQ